ncbi:glyoxylate/hydroxypyruvate reductase A [Salinisphaera sp. SPP-AMP-43]|uniref:2-hydroxyacid dehydrogenase n=1 Tax=Salinisphaera sp. SPP-AMP-43 TaxID=3121288 RepID=UPI003C6DF377
MTLLYWAYDDERAERWAQLFAERAPEWRFKRPSEIADADEVRFLLAWRPPKDIAQRFPNLEVIFATSAGVDQFDFDRIPASVPIVRMHDPQIERGVVEYASFATLYLHRDIDRYQRQQRAGLWQPHRPVAAGQRRIGILGLGRLGRAIAERLRSLGFQVGAWSRSAHRIDGIDCFYGADGRNQLLADTDILINILPLTESTHSLLDSSLFARLPRGAGLINIGRGAHLVEADLIAALNDGQLRAAVIDVVGEEPPPDDHPFWQDARILMTPHIAAMTDPDTAFEVLLANLRRYQAGEPMHGVVDRGLGY